MNKASVLRDLAMEWYGKGCFISGIEKEQRCDAARRVETLFRSLYLATNPTCGLCGKPLNKNYGGSCYYTDCQWGLPEVPTEAELYALFYA